MAHDRLVSLKFYFNFGEKMFGLIKSILVALICSSAITFSVQAQVTAASENVKKIVPVLFLLLEDDEKSCEYNLQTPALAGAANAETVMGSWPDDAEPSDSLLLDSEGNCLSPTLEPDGDFYVSFYTFTVTTESSYFLRLSSATVVPQIIVLDEDGNTIAENFAPKGSLEVVLGNNGELDDLEPGDYTIEVTTLFAVDEGEEVEGDYNLTLERKAF